jgi:hypothetical protein
LVRDVLKNGGDVMQFLPDVVAKSLSAQQATQLKIPNT